MKNYYFYPPKKPQFFFPKKKFKEYQQYYSPFSIKSKVFWFIYKNSIFVRAFFRKNEEEISLPITTIKKIINLKRATYFYNVGTAGTEQSATIIAKNKEGQQLFLKFAQKERAKELVANEAKILLALEKQIGFKTAKVYESDVNDNYAYMLTEVIVSTKVSFTRLTNSVFKLLLVLAKIEAKEEDIKEVFAHGDFCPWNMLLTQNKELVLIDWEMAGTKILGYDLFTYLFQTNFLLYPAKSIPSILLENREDIISYFKEFQIVDWTEYLIKFARIKVIEEKQKTNSLLLLKYQELFKYNE